MKTELYEKKYYVDRRFKELSHKDTKTQSEEQEFLMLNNTPHRYVQAFLTPNGEYTYITEEHFNTPENQSFTLSKLTFELLYEEA